MRSGKQICIHPANVGNLILLLIAGAFLLCTIPVLLNGFDTSIPVLLRIFSIPLTMFGGYIGVLLLFIALMPRMALFGDSIQVVHWKDGLPYSPKNSRSIRLPRTNMTRIGYDDLKMYGAYFAKDINEYLRTREGYLFDNWVATLDTPTSARIIFPKGVAGLAGYVIITGDNQFQPFLWIFGGLFMLALGLSEFRKGQKVTGWLGVAVFIMSTLALIKEILLK